jgi:hypothetical protein
MAIEAWQTTAQAKRQELEGQIAATDYASPQVKDGLLNVTTLSLDGLLSSRQLEITELGPEVLVAEIAKGTYSAVEVTVGRHGSSILVCQSKGLELTR